MSDGRDLQQIAESAWVAPTAQIYGRVSIGEDSSVWHNAVIRAECESVCIGRMTNLQDFVMVHVGYESPTEVGDFCSVAHHATVHGCSLGDHCLVGVGAVIMDGARIGRGSIVAGGAVVREGSEFPPGSVIAGVPAKLVRERDSSRANRLNAWQYHRNAQAYRRGEHRAWDGAEYRRWLADKLREIESDRDL